MPKKDLSPIPPAGVVKGRPRLLDRLAAMRVDEWRRRRPDNGMPAMADPPKGPLPLRGGAEAPLDP